MMHDWLPTRIAEQRICAAAMPAGAAAGAALPDWSALQEWMMK
jgi:hypothetical protein